MIVEYVRYRVPEGQADAFAASVTDAQPIISAAASCRSFEMRRGVEDPTEFVARVEWDSIAGHHAFRDGPTFAEFKSKMAGFSIESLGHYEAL